MFICHSYPPVIHLIYLTLFMHKAIKCNSIIAKFIFSFSLILTLGNVQAQTPFSGTRPIGSGGYYSTLTAAIADAAYNGVNGPVTFLLMSTYNSSSETFPITIGNISGTNATNTITIVPQTGVSGLSIISSNSTATIDLNGANYIIIDGRPGGVGSRNLSIGNTSTTGVAIRFINDACFNTIKHDTIFGVNSASAGGVVFFSSTTGTRGNDSNTVDSCDIKDGATTPSTSVYSLGTTTSAAQYNSNNFITNCNIYNFWNGTSECNAFKISGGNTDWIMKGNSMFQTATRTATAAFQQYIWNCNNSSANNHLIANNYIGGTAPQCGGTAWTVTSSVGFRFTGAYLNVGGVTPSTFSGNTFANFNVTSGTSVYGTIPGVFSGPWLVGGITNVIGNTFGSMTSANSIVVTSNVNGNMIVPIGATGTTAGVINIRGNNIGGITAAGTSASISSNLFAINTSSASTAITYNIDSNIIGNYLADNMLNSSSSTSTTGQQLAGFYCTSTSYINFRYNTIRNFRNNAIGTSITPTNWLHGIDISGNSVDSIIGNKISNLTIGSAYQNNTSGSASLIGIRFVPATAGNFISGNQFFGFTHTNSGAASVSVLGIVTNNTLSPTTIQKNILHSYNLLSTSTASYLIGIYVVGGSAKYVNNIIRLGIDSGGNSITTTPIIYGIFKTAGAINLFNNSIFIGGTGVGTGTSNTFAFNSSLAGVDSIFNNIFSNERSNSSTGGVHYATSLASNTTLNCNTNNYWFSGNGGALGLFGTTTCSSISSWISNSSVDAGSGVGNPQFLNPTGGNSTINMHISPTIPTSIEHNGIFISSVTDDIDGQQRSSLTPTDIGADAGNFVYYTLPVSLTEFNAKAIQNDVKINWTTSSEINNDGFEIERSNDGINFVKITFVKGNGKSNSIINYDYFDTDAFIKTNAKVLFYRLKQIDFNGEYTYSNIVSLCKTQSLFNSVTIHPNPFENTTSISFTTENSGKGVIELSDITGRKIMTKELEITKGENSFELNESASLQQGIYFVRLTVNGNSSVIKIVKAN